RGSLRQGRDTRRVCYQPLYCSTWRPITLGPSISPSIQDILVLMDTVSPQVRSRMMAGIRGKDTQPERLVRTALFARGFRYRKNCRDLPGRPDLKLTRYGAVILIHGCFWHGHDCRYFRLPQSNSGFWQAKIDANRARDARNITALRQGGWRVCVIWECATRRSPAAACWLAALDALEAWLRGGVSFLELYNPAALDSLPGRGRCSRPGSQESCGIGANADQDLFVAQRCPDYRCKEHPGQGD
ncbi:MAG: very short patch repair endonuclease, partial [Planctomycetota bacterium]